MSGINAASSPVIPALAASSASAGAAGGTTFAVQILPTTGTGLTLILVVMAIAFILAGAIILWNPLRRHRDTPGTFITVALTHTGSTHQSSMDPTDQS